MNKVKRAVDLTGAAIGLMLLWPLFLLIALLIKWDDRETVFFRQERIGFRGKPFHILKFRTMTANPRAQARLLTVGRDPRITRVGYFLRQTKLDEFPQLINVLRGEMSLVGPRPEVARYVTLYTPEQMRVLDLVPGITDVASIAYRKESELLAQATDPQRMYIEQIMPMKIGLNLEYASRATVWSDLLIIYRTFLNLIT